MSSKPEISIVIVNYNVKDFLRDCINSIYKSNTTHTYEIIVVDNNSSDDSVKELSTSFPHINFVQLEENLGFSRANNIGFELAQGEYVLILNPDTILSQDTLEKTINFFKSDEKIGAVGCKVLNADLTFQLACRRSFPTPWNSFSKLFGLQNLFPKSKIFAQYNLTYLDEDRSYEVDALIGAFIFTKIEILKEIGGFDESYFMYGEDLDLCFKIKSKNYKIFYYHETSIIHFKGESTKRSNINEVKHFYEAMQIFVKKHYSSSLFFLSFLKYGIKLREFFSYLSKYKIDIVLIILDLLLMFIIFPVVNKLRYGNYDGYPVENYYIYLAVVSVFTLFSQFISGNYFEKDVNLRKGLFSGATILLSVGFFVYLIRGFDLSRIVLLITSISFGILSYLMRELIFFKKNKINRSYIIYGNNELSTEVSNALQSDGVKVFSAENDEQLFKMLNNKVADNILICNESDLIEFKTKIFQFSDSIRNVFKINDFKDFHLKFNIYNSLENISPFKSKLDLLRIKFIKRSIDIIAALLFIPLAIFKVKGLKSSFTDMINLFSGKRTLVGIKQSSKKFNYKLGILSLAELNKSKNEEEITEISKYYINNYSLTLDFDIFVKSIFNKKR